MLEEWERIFREEKNEPPNEHASIEDHIRFVSEQRRLEERLAFARMVDTCESPIEELVYVYLWYHAMEGELRFIPQSKVGKYRLDFEVDIEGKKIDLECDGHDFHEKTKEQAAKDKKRDRYLASMGYTVLRFTGSEISKNPHKVVKEVIDTVYTEMIRRDHPELFKE